MNVYHLSPSVGIVNVEPAFSQGRDKVVWVCTWALIPWAVRHVGRHQRCDWLYVYRARIGRGRLIRRRRGVYCTKERLKVQLCGVLSVTENVSVASLSAALNAGNNVL